MINMKIAIFAISLTLLAIGTVAGEENNKTIADDNSTVIVANYNTEPMVSMKLEEIDSRHVRIVINNPYDRMLYASGDINIFNTDYETISRNEANYEIPARNIFVKVITIRSNVSILAVESIFWFSFEKGRYNVPLAGTQQSWIRLTDYNLLFKEMTYNQTTGSVASILLLAAAWIVYKHEKDKKNK